MYSQRFLKLIRQYAALASRHKTSYAAPVQQLVDMEMNKLALTITDQAELAAAQLDLQEMVMREYAPSDSAFDLTATS